MTRSSTVSIIKVLGFDNNEIVDNSSNRLNKKLSKFKKPSC